MYEDEDLEEWIEDEGDEDDVILQCPNCKADVHEDTQQCPRCGDYIIPVYPHAARGRAVWTVAALLVIIAIIIMIVT